MPQQRIYYVYIMGSLSGTLYIGVTGHLRRRVWQHKEHDIEGFTSRYEVDRLLYFEAFTQVGDAIARKATQGMAPREEDRTD
jgi:putative endonuclease